MSTSHLNSFCNSAEFLESARRFASWLETAGYTSYDPYDVWGTRYGLWARKVYYANSLLGMPLIAPLLVMEILWPDARRFLVQKQRYATADAQLILAFLNLLSATGDDLWLDKASLLSEQLLRYSIPGYSGHCWGYPFDWETNKGLWQRNTPFITCTPYCFEAFLALHDATGQERYRDIAASIAQFVYADLNDTETSADAAAASYSPHDQTKVINASAYRAFVLIEAAERFENGEFRAKALNNIRFILQNQREDGSWLYAIDNPAEVFIDHFHTCFVLKNLFKLNRRLNSREVRRAIQRGYGYYRRELFDSNDDPKSFAIEPRMQLTRLELYDFAEAISLGVLVRNEMPEAFVLACELAKRMMRKYQLPDGHIVTRVYLGGLGHTLPFLRWPQAQLFYAITNLLLVRDGSTGRALVPSSAACEA